MLWQPGVIRTSGRFGVLSEEDWKAVDEAMEAVQVSELRERDFQTLSDGQRQRVMLARALCQEPGTAASR